MPLRAHGDDCLPHFLEGTEHVSGDGLKRRGHRASAQVADIAGQCTNRIRSRECIAYGVDVAGMRALNRKQHELDGLQLAGKSFSYAAHAVEVGMLR